MFKPFFALWVWCCLALAVRADVIDDNATLQGVVDEALVDLQGDRWTPEVAAHVTAALAAFGADFSSPEANVLWSQELSGSLDQPAGAAVAMGALQARLQHAAAIEMIQRQESGDIEAAREWRSIIMLPKYANAVEGAMALQRMGAELQHRQEVSRLLAREYVQWQITRAREKTDALARLANDGRATPLLVKARATEIQKLAQIPASLLALALPNEKAATPPHGAYDSLVAADPSAGLAQPIAAWRLELEGSYPNLLSADDVQHRERIILKLLRLIPMEYNSGVRAGEITIPIEYREAKSFTIQTEQIVNELMPVWKNTKAKALEEHGPQLLKGLENLEQLVNARKSQAEVEGSVKEIMSILQKDFDLSLKRAGTAADVVAEAALEIRALLGQSLAAAKDGQWRKADQFRLDAYVNFDLELESRAVPRDPNLALSAERTFLDGESGKPGIKAALDARLSGDELTAAYQRAFDALDQTTALLRVGLSPAAAIMNAVFIILREGLEAVVILAALLAGLRGPENAPIRKQIGIGAWLAILASILLFALSRYLLSGLSKYGETLEAVISVVAVIVLLIVTNWVFHKYYWSGWYS
ncbi:MAG: High-affinity iron transporter [Akkermansiaceae bacterium]|nr:High-affinity iron transporter [Akkermansiaceae bacterium]